MAQSFKKPLLPLVKPCSVQRALFLSKLRETGGRPRYFEYPREPQAYRIMKECEDECEKYVHEGNGLTYYDYRVEALFYERRWPGIKYPGIDVDPLFTVALNSYLEIVQDLETVNKAPPQSAGPPIIALHGFFCRLFGDWLDEFSVLREMLQECSWFSTYTHPDLIDTIKHFLSLDKEEQHEERVALITSIRDHLKELPAGHIVSEGGRLLRDSERATAILEYARAARADITSNHPRVTSLPAVKSETEAKQGSEITTSAAVSEEHDSNSNASTGAMEDVTNRLDALEHRLESITSIEELKNSVNALEKRLDSIAAPGVAKDLESRVDALQHLADSNESTRLMEELGIRTKALEKNTNSSTGMTKELANRLDAIERYADSIATSGPIQDLKDRVNSLELQADSIAFTKPIEDLGIRLDALEQHTQSIASTTEPAKDLATRFDALERRHSDLIATTAPIDDLKNRIGALEIHTDLLASSESIKDLKSQIDALGATLDSIITKPDNVEAHENVGGETDEEESDSEYEDVNTDESEEDLWGGP